jgi:hypothetical protein
MMTANAPFVRVSKTNPHYFELADQTPFIPNGLNLSFPRCLSKEDEVLDYYREMLDELAVNRANYARIWANHPFFDVEHDRSGIYDRGKLERLKTVIAMARERGIRLKITLEYFRRLDAEAEPFPGSLSFGKPLHHRRHGGNVESMTEFFQAAHSRDRFRRKLDFFRDEVGETSAVFAWELWNEINSVAVPRQVWQDWTETMLAELHRRFPNTMAVQSLGSYCRENQADEYAPFCRLPGNDFSQIHRYLDPGAELDVCRGPMDLLCADAIRRLGSFNAGRPLMLAEGGAVEKHHAGPSKLYERDCHGTLLHDVIFAPFFAGSAGTGQCWHWQLYVRRHNLWHHFGRFAAAVEGIDPITEAFEAEQVERGPLRIHALRGKRHTLLWCRDRHNDWRSELVQGVSPTIWKGLKLDLHGLVRGFHGKLEAYLPWRDSKRFVTGDGQIVVLPEFERSIVLRVTHQ